MGEQLLIIIVLTVPFNQNTSDERKEDGWGRKMSVSAEKTRQRFKKI